jgi:hypothetical protein
MGYTYDDFVTAANKAGVMNRFSDNDLSTAKKNPEYGMSMVGLMQDVSNAKTDEQRLLATEAANQMRKNYGVYNIGNSASDYSYAASYGSTIDDLMGQIKDYGSFDYGSQEEYQKLLDSIVNQQPFSYDLESDPSWQAYKKAYLREGERASANALALASAASGGRPSSYAMTAAQQAGNYYAGQLGDMIPTLEQNAYARYRGDFADRMSSLGALETDRAFNYENWVNEYNMLQNSLGNYQGQDATDYQRYLDAYSRQHQAEQERLAQDQLAYEKAMTLYQTMGYATPEVAKILGIPAGTKVAGKSSGGSGGSGSRKENNKSNTSINPTPTNDDDDLTIDQDSILALGYGPISESKLNELVNAGVVKEVRDGNVIRFVKVQTPSTTGSSRVPMLPTLPGTSSLNPLKR